MLATPLEIPLTKVVLVIFVPELTDAMAGLLLLHTPPETG
jgi:hypothetical protein